MSRPVFLVAPMCWNCGLPPSLTRGVMGSNDAGGCARPYADGGRLPCGRSGSSGGGGGSGRSRGRGGKYGRMRRAPGPIGHPSPGGRSGRIGKTDTMRGRKGQDRRERWGDRTRKREKGRRWSSNPSGKCSYERPTRGIVCGTMHSMCGAGAGCLAINYQSLFIQSARGLTHRTLPRCYRQGSSVTSLQ